MEKSHQTFSLTTCSLIRLRQSPTDMFIMFKDKKVVSFHLFPCFDKLSLLWKENPPTKEHKNSMCSMRPWKEVWKGERKGLKPREPLYMKIHRETEFVTLANPRAGWVPGPWRKILLSMASYLETWLQGRKNRNLGKKHLCPCTQTHTHNYRRILINCFSLTHRQELTEQFTPYIYSLLYY